MNDIQLSHQFLLSDPIYSSASTTAWNSMVPGKKWVQLSILSDLARALCSLIFLRRTNKPESRKSLIWLLGKLSFHCYFVLYRKELVLKLLEEKTEIKQHQEQFDEYQNEKDTRPQNNFFMNADVEWKIKFRELSEIRNIYK